jgi:Subtilisin inhibitor-like
MAMTRQAHDRRTPSPSGRLLSRCAAAAVCALLVAACGSTAAPHSGAAGSSPSSPAAGTSGPATTATAKISLDVTFSGSPTTAAAHYTLRCEPAGGTVTDPAAACAKLLKGTSLFGPLPAHVECPMIMANAGRATVTGSYLGRPVHETVVDGGCDLGRWAKLKQVFG